MHRPIGERRNYLGTGSSAGLIGCCRRPPTDHVGRADGPLCQPPGRGRLLLVSKYAELRDWLRQSGRVQVRCSFDRLNDLVPGGLPPSAYAHDAWWSNESSPGSTHSQSRLGWMAAGYRVELVDRRQRYVVFAQSSVGAA
ncbi:DUF7662 domain-containing protein [Nucisporomicrobium flavum]|uniref:DUF7662 domain-containing protein n=1 Tax=Nucisporomicrobium flavum TaxID=2785915 RepID=UPI003C30E194